MSESLAGVTFLAFGNGSPDVFSTFAAMSTHSSSLAIGELVGAAGFISAVVAGSMALVRPFRVAKKSFIRDVGFFVVAAAFSMGFLADGKLHLWECIAMVLFYVFYVVFVVTWHWWLGRRRKRREKDALARGHYITPGSEDIAVQEEYFDEEDGEGGSRPALSRGASTDDMSALESAGTPTLRIQEPYDDDQEEERERWLGEISSNMRVSRPGPRSRRGTMNPIRPSLVGALEFQAVLNTLQKSRNIQTIPLNARRYSDDPTFTSAQQQDAMSARSDPASRPPFELRIGSDTTQPQLLRPDPAVGGASSQRSRAVSANDISGMRVDHDFLGRHASRHPSLLDIHEDDSRVDGESTASGDNEQHMSRILQSPSVTLSPAQMHDGTASETLLHSPHTRSPEYLAPPNDEGRPSHQQSTSRHQDDLSFRNTTRHKMQTVPKIRLPDGRKSPLAQSPASSPFPSFVDLRSATNQSFPDLHLGPPSFSDDADLQRPDGAPSEHARPLRWWPYQVLPGPVVLLSTLFPTFCQWGQKNLVEKLLGIVAAPSVFLLTITLPVVETDKDDASEEGYEAIQDMGNVDLTRPEPRRQGSMRDQRRQSISFALDSAGLVPDGTTILPGSPADAERHRSQVEQQPYKGTDNERTISEDAPTHPHAVPPQRAWNRWLTMVQLFTAPIMVVLIIYTQYIEPETSLAQALVKPILIALLISTVLLVPFLLTTTPTRRPAAYTSILALAGFIVSIAWISTIAAQVVAILKAFAIILNMSHAILGLTVFAVGNSLGDLVADITVARLGYPVMALSACFGGPMLNILLGIGLSGSWILIRGAERRQAKHPDKEIHFRTYEIEVGETLVISAITLLVTLVSLLIAVPLNKWMMSRRIAWFLIALWCIGTIINVVLEVLGVDRLTAMMSRT